jgi:hypothetical protein
MTLRSTIRAMECLPLRWIAWQILNLIRANRAEVLPATDGCPALLRDLLRREMGHDEAGVILGRVRESSCLPTGCVADDPAEADTNHGPREIARKGRGAWGSWPAAPGACLWPSMAPADLCV